MKIVVIGGPTATGKTALSIAVAKRFDGEIVSADSMQIYRRMDIGTAKPSIEERAGIRHVMMDEIDPEEPFSVAQYCQMAKQYIADMAERGKLPILVGGTGLYIRSLVDNVDFTECEVDYDYRMSLRRLAEEKGGEALHAELAKIDPVSAETIHPNNIKRLVRALECYHTTGMTKTELDERAMKRPPLYEPFMTALTMERQKLYDRIDRRVELMMEAGLADEVRMLKQSGLKREDISMQGIGYKELFASLEGEMTLEESVDLIQRKSRNYAKRQLTWFRQDGRYRWFDALDPELVEHFLDETEQFLYQGREV